MARNPVPFLIPYHSRVVGGERYRRVRRRLRGRRGPQAGAARSRRQPIAPTADEVDETFRAPRAAGACPQSASSTQVPASGVGGAPTAGNVAGTRRSRRPCITMTGMASVSRSARVFGSRGWRKSVPPLWASAPAASGYWLRSAASSTSRVRSAGSSCSGSANTNRDVPSTSPSEPSRRRACVCIDRCGHAREGGAWRTSRIPRQLIEVSGGPRVGRHVDEHEPTDWLGMSARRATPRSSHPSSCPRRSPVRVRATSS